MVSAWVSIPFIFVTQVVSDELLQSGGIQNVHCKKLYFALLSLSSSWKCWLHQPSSCQNYTFMVHKERLYRAILFHLHKSICMWNCRVAPDASVNSRGQTLVSPRQKARLSPKIESLLISRSDNFPPPIHLRTPPLMIHLKRMWQALESLVSLWKQSSWIRHVQCQHLYPRNTGGKTISSIETSLQSVRCGLAPYYLDKCGWRLS